MRLLLVLAFVLALVAPAQAVPPERASLPDVEDEVMCIECGTVLSVSNSPVAQQERDFIREQIAAGRDKEQIKTALVDEYGEDVIADPKTPWLWIVPVALALIAAAGGAVAVPRRRPPAPPARTPPPPP